MTRCLSHDGRGHAFPVEDESGAYCPEHEVTLLCYGAPITADDLAPEAAPDKFTK
ncbi:hypothetical protein GCM10010329_64840 [Streptomyces spiroverticillatus]|uniref:Uncharacterized protein n=1 Tax=Streptomyces finlayi TaxID=67296 RepID=A0A918X473_9ACTN|nr:hypothetical protein [Streptomyces finlayi]GHA32516.1 hypothetical protein GCM10010329_64840 [Streptomyces spiroverticillatus]GHD10525.1 hypothetical protein GCM10010334_65710 [Streptomyces finlayi]